MTICSLVLQTYPNRIDSTTKYLRAIPDVEIHAQDNLGKIIITIDNPSRSYCSQVMTDITSIEGMMSTSLIYEYQDDLVNQVIQNRTAQSKEDSHETIET